MVSYFHTRQDVDSSVCFYQSNIDQQHKRNAKSILNFPESPMPVTEPHRVVKIFLGYNHMLQICCKHFYNCPFQLNEAWRNPCASHRNNQICRSFNLKRDFHFSDPQQLVNGWSPCELKSPIQLTTATKCHRFHCLFAVFRKVNKQSRL